MAGTYTSTRGTVQDGKQRKTAHMGGTPFHSNTRVQNNTPDMYLLCCVSRIYILPNSRYSLPTYLIQRKSDMVKLY